MTHTSLYRMKGLLTLAELLAQIGPEIAERTTAWLREALEPGETMPNVAFLLKLVERRLRRLRESLRARDGRLSRALTALTVARRLRDQAAGKMRGVLINGRDLLGSCTRESVAFTTFRGRISQRWHRAFYQAEAFLVNLRDSYFRPVALPGLLDYPKAEIEKSLVATMGEVATASQAAVKAEAEVTAARFRLKDEQDETARAHRWTLQLVEALGFLVDAPELVERLPPSLRKEASKGRRHGHKKKKEPEASLRSGPSLDLTAETSLESGPSSDLQPETSLESGPSSDLQPETSLKSSPSLDLQPEISLKSGPSLDLTAETSLKSDPSLDLAPETSLKSGPSLASRVTKRRRGENRRRMSSVRGATTREQPSPTPDTPRTTAETTVGEPPNAAAVRRNGDARRLHVASFRGNRRPSASARGGDRAKRWLLASSRGVDHRCGGLERPENGEFRAGRPWKEKILGIFGR